MTTAAPNKVEAIEKVSVTEFSRTPGPRFVREGKYSGEEFRDSILIQKYELARASHHKLMIDLDGTAGFGSSFLEEAFGGLARKYQINEVLETLQFKSDEETYLIEEILEYIRTAEPK